MKTIKYIFLSFIIFLNTNIIFSQGSNSKYSIHTENSGRLLELMNILRYGTDKPEDTKNIPDENYKGSPFMSDNFSPTDLILNNKSIGVFLMRYNIYNDEFQIKDKAEPPYGTIHKVNHVDILHNEVLFKVFDYENKSKKLVKGYFQTPVYDRNCSLLIKNRKKYKAEIKSKNSYTKDIPAKFIDANSYYLKFGNDLPVTFKLKNKEILKVFPDHKKLMKQFIDQDNINVKNENDLIKLINYYNSIDSAL